MSTKWFEDGLSEEALTKAYRQLAKKYHPDVSQEEDAEEKFKEFSAEYTARMTALERAQAPAEMVEVEVIQHEVRKRAEVAAKVVAEVYPRTNISWSVGIFDVFLEFNASTPLPKMVHIVTMTQGVLGSSLNVATEFKRDGAKKVRSLKVDGNCVFVDCNVDDVPVLGEWKLVHKGRRYLQYAQGRWTHVWDTKTDTKYFMRKSPKLTLQELLGL